MIKVRILGNWDLNGFYENVDKIIEISNQFDNEDVTIKEFTDRLRLHQEFIGNVYKVN